MKLIRILTAFIIAILELLCCASMLLVPEYGINIVILILSIVLTLFGLRKIFYFFTMGIHMVGGKTILYEGLIATDLGIFTYCLTDLPKQFVMIYLLIYYVFEGVIEIYRAMESKKVQSVYWITKVLGGLFYILIAVLCIINMNSLQMMIYIFCAGLAYSAIKQIVSSFKKTTFVYIQ